MCIYYTLGLSLFLTLILEELFAVLCKKRGKALLLVALVNLLTNPPLVLLWVLSGHVRWLLLLLEAAAVEIEGFYYHRCSDQFPYPYRFSLCCNAFSFGIGLLMNGVNI